MAMAMGSNYFPPPGFRFRPYEEELIKNFLRPKIYANDPQVDKFIPTIRLSDFHPSDIPHELKMPWEDKMWYFFSVREKLREKGNQCKRKGISGFWKSTCKEKDMQDSETDECIGKKRILVYHDSPGIKTDHVIYEYALNDPIVNQTQLKLKSKTSMADPPASSENTNSLSS